MGVEQDTIKRRGPKETLSIALYPDLIKLIEEVCKREGRSRSNYIGRVLEEHFKILLKNS